ncbi:MAG: three-Cys-motif partner protein TcmP [Pseudonocardiaceae bacterium]
MSRPKATLWELEPHSRAKHVILRNYLHAWLPIMSSLVGHRAIDGRGRLVLVDGFAGPGRYAGGEPGSPLIMLNAFLEHARRDLIRAELVYLFIEDNEERADHLESETAAFDLPDQVKVQVIHGRYEDVFTGAMDSMSESGGTLAPTFAFVDPFGYADVSMQLTDRLLRFRRCEALVYMPLPFVTRFIRRDGQEQAMDNLFGCSDWRNAIPLNGAERRDYLHDLFRDQLAAEGDEDRIVRSFEVPTASGTGYYLFFTTTHEKGIEAMKDAMWAADPFEGQRFRDTTVRDQLVIFKPDVSTGPLLQALRERFGAEPFTIEEAVSFTLRDTAYKRGHLKRNTLAPAERDGQLESLSSRKRAVTYPDGTKLRFCDT